MSTTAILLAAGSGQRMQGHVEDKVLAPINGKPAILYSLQAFVDADVIDQFIIVYRDEAQKLEIATLLQSYGLDHLKILGVSGGSERQLSVIHALNVVDDACKYVFIHDCARPCVRHESIAELHRTVQTDQAACLAHPVVDTIKRISVAGKLKQQSLEDLKRDRLWAMETPQAFSFKNILKAYQHVVKEKLSITDDTAAAASIGLKTTLVPNTHPNPKLTTPADLAYIEFLVLNS
jgi:2-C-methyl-D-erythritol 4-phosphate cytidylyltransferase